MPGSFKGFRKAVALASACLFLGFLSLPLLDQAFHLAPKVNLMETEPTPLPSVGHNLSQLFKSFYVLQRGYLERTFGFRRVLVRMENMLDIFCLHSTTHYQSVIEGKHQWLFLSQENNDLNVVDDYRAGRLYTPGQTERWVDIYKQRQAWLAGRGIRYLIVVAPNKDTIYPEYLPDKYNKINAVSRTDQLVKALTRAGVDIIDLRPLMLSIKKQALAYYRTDTHWTPYGAFAAYVEIMNGLSKWFPRYGNEIRGEFDIEISPGLPGGLAYMLALGDKYPEDKVTLIPKIPRVAKDAETPPSKPEYFQPTVVKEVPDQTLKSAVIFRDSFAHELVPFLSEHFRRAVYVWPHPSTPRSIRFFDEDVIEKEKPDVVIDEFVERYFTEFPPMDDAIQPTRLAEP